MTGNAQKTLISEAIRIAGTQEILASGLGCAQTKISKLLHEEIPVSGEDALAIHRVTRGKVSASKLRPDLWPTPRIAKLAAEAVSA